MTKISDEIRQLRDVCCDDCVDKGCCDEMRALADRIDRELVELPKDAHGEYIHAGDMLDGYGKTIEVVELRHGRSGWVLISRDGNGYADCAAFAHHHAQTVEDLLAEMLDAWGELPSNVTNEAIIAEYAARLRLAGEDE